VTTSPPLRDKIAFTVMGTSFGSAQARNANVRRPGERPDERISVRAWRRDSKR